MKKYFTFKGYDFRYEIIDGNVSISLVSQGYTESRLRLIEAAAEYIFNNKGELREEI